VIQLASSPRTGKLSLGEPERGEVPADGIKFTPDEISAYYKVRVPELKQTPHRAWWRGPCPIHFGLRDSFSVNPTTGWWHCFSDCDHGGSMFDLEQLLTGEGRATALINVARIMGR
jgi:hypothetical protein